MRHVKLPLAIGGSLLKAEVGWIRARLGGVGRLEVLGQSLDLRQVFQLEWVISLLMKLVGGGPRNNLSSFVNQIKFIVFKRVQLKKVYSAIVPHLFFSQIYTAHCKF